MVGTPIENFLIELPPAWPSCHGTANRGSDAPVAGLSHSVGRRLLENRAWRANAICHNATSGVHVVCDDNLRRRLDKLFGRNDA